MGTDTKQMRRKKIARLFCLARDLGMSNEMLHAAIYGVTGCDSIRLLNLSQLDMSIRILEKELHDRKKHHYQKNSQYAKQPNSRVLFLPTINQRRMVDFLVARIVRHQDDAKQYLDYICNKTFGKQYQMLNRREMKNLIEALKSIKRRRIC